jgi:hypothetical protein
VATPEAKVKAAVKTALDKYFPDHYRFMPVQSGYGSQSLDFLICVRGKFIAIETKAPGKSPTPLQSSRIAAMHAAGAFVCVVDGPLSLAEAITQIMVLTNVRDDATYLRPQEQA